VRSLKKIVSTGKLIEFIKNLLSSYKEGVMIRKTHDSAGNLMDYSDIDDRFEPYYDSGERVEVTWKDGFEDYSGYGARTEGKKARFYVGISSGWKPVFLQIYSRRSIGGFSIMSAGVKSIRGLGIYQ
jgi:hypothetical protein